MKSLAKLEDLLLDAACQGGLAFDGHGGQRGINTCALSTWEDVCHCLTERGRLKRINDCIYEIVPVAAG